MSPGGKLIFTNKSLTIDRDTPSDPYRGEKQHTIDKYTLENKELAAITRRDATIVARVWPVAENYTALVLLDNLILHYGYQKLMDMVGSRG